MKKYLWLIPVVGLLALAGFYTQAKYVEYRINKNLGARTENYWDDNGGTSLRPNNSSIVDVSPLTDNSTDLGTPALRWKSLSSVSTTITNFTATNATTTNLAVTNQFSLPAAAFALETVNVGNVARTQTTSILSDRIGINSSSAIASLGVQGKSSLNPLAIVSSSAASMFTVLTNGKVGINSSSPISNLSVQGTSGQNVVSIIGSNGTGLYEIDSAGNSFFRSASADATIQLSSVSGMILTPLASKVFVNGTNPYMRSFSSNQAMGMKGNMGSSAGVNTFVDGEDPRQNTTGTSTQFQIRGIFAPTSGSGDFIGLDITPTLSTTATFAGGRYTSLRISPLVTSASGTAKSYIFDAGTNSAANGTGGHTSLFSISTTGTVTIGTPLSNTLFSDTLQVGRVVSSTSAVGSQYAEITTFDLQTAPTTSTSFASIYGYIQASTSVSAFMTSSDTGTNFFGVQGDSDFYGTGGAHKSIGVLGQGSNSGSGLVEQVMGVNASGISRSSGKVADMYGVRVTNLLTGAGNATNSYGVWIDNPTETGGGSIFNNYGVYIDNQTSGATLDYALYSAGGQSYHAGKFGIGSTTPGYNLTVTGTVAFDNLPALSGATANLVCWRADGNLTQQATNCTISDLNKKTNIKEWKRGLELILALNPLVYDEKAGLKDQLGLGAQDVAKVDKHLAVSYENGKDWRTVDYMKLTLPLINAVKELNAQNKEQDNEIQMLKNRVYKLETGRTPKENSLIYWLLGGAVAVSLLALFKRK